MLQIPDPLENRTIEKTLRTTAEIIEQLYKQKIKDLLLHAADMLERLDAQLLAVNDELVKAGLQPWQYDSFAACVAVLRGGGRHANPSCLMIPPLAGNARRCTACPAI